MKSLNRSIRYRLKKACRSADTFGYSINLHYKNDSSFKSTFGGICSITAKLLVLAYFLFQLSTVITNGQTIITYRNTKKDLSRSKSPLYVTRERFDFAAYVYINLGNETLTQYYQERIDEYFTIEYFQQEIILPVQNSTNVGYQEINTSINLTRCGENLFKYLKSNNELTSIASQYYCPANDDATQLSGYYSSESTKLITIQLNYCKQEFLNLHYPGSNKTCKSKNESGVLIPYIQFRFPYMTQYFDAHEYNQNPIKQFLQTNLYRATLNQYVSYNLKMQQNFALLKDSWFSNNIANENLTFYDIIQDYTIVGEQSLKHQESLISIHIYESDNRQTIQRQVYTFLDALSSTGGIMGTIFGIFKFLISGIQQSLFELSIMRKLFMVQNKEKLQDKRRSYPRRNNVYNSDTIKVQSISQSIDSSFSFQNDKRYQQRVSDPDSNQMHLVAKLKQFILSLEKYKLSYWNLLSLKIRRTFNCFCKHKQPTKDYKLYMKGKQQLKEEFDIVRILKNMRYLQAQQKIQLQKYQRLFLHYIQANVISVNQKQIHEQNINIKPAFDKSEIDSETYKPDLDNNIEKLVKHSQNSKIDKKLLKLTLIDDKEDLHNLISQKNIDPNYNHKKLFND